ncbi:cytochrome P450 [Mesorhizobium sp. NBSH29]|uniref:cytochrome P450 n=1 Tax=Mesorhizobium sp. NBSH29 TaxID=2654249 RepID=UPI00189643F5|nr:cytochrome P450 [Mesorhizobium sp. NBSH29]QPC87457.1 cytochrome P450 [Mesorhizobium sp. NBSH29]
MDSHLPFLQFAPETRQLRLDPHAPAFYNDTYPAYAFLHGQVTPFFWEEFGLWCFGGFDDVNRLLRDRRFGRQNSEGIPDSRGAGDDRAHLAAFDAVEAHSLLELEPPLHTRLRTLVTRAFVSRQVERLRPRVEALAHELIDCFEPGGSTELLASFATPLPITIISEMLGVPAEMGPRLLDWSHAMVSMYTHGRTRADEDRANLAAAEFCAFLRDYAQRRRDQPGDDLLSLLIAARDRDSKLSEDEMVSSAILLLNAGHEATVHQIGNGVRAILAAGGDPRRFFATPEHTAATVEECLRFAAPLHMFTRYAYEPVEMGGITIEPGQSVGLLLGMANRDPRAFANPDTFDPARTDQKNVSFGAGIHFCIGAPLARLELQVALKVLFERCPQIAVSQPPKFRDSFHFHGLERLVVTV